MLKGKQYYDIYFTVHTGSIMGFLFSWNKNSAVHNVRYGDSGSKIDTGMSVIHNIDSVWNHQSEL